MRLILAVCLILLQVSIGFSQDSASLFRQDSLREVVKSLDIDTLRANAYIKLADTFKYQNLDSVLFYIDLAEKSLQEKTYPKILANSTSYIAGVYFTKGEYSKAIAKANEGLKLIEDIPGTSKLEADLERILGVSYGSIGDYARSLQSFIEIGSIYESLGDTNGVLLSLNNIGVIHIKLENFEEALKIFLRLESMATNSNPQNVTIPVNLGFIYYELDELEKAKTQLNKALAYPGEVDKRAYGLSNFKLGQVYIKEGNLDEAISAFNASLEVYEELGNELEKAQSLNGLALVYIELNQPEVAKKYAFDAFEISTRFNALPEKNTSLKTLYEVSKVTGNYRESLQYHEEFKATSDSLQDSEVKEELGRLVAEYEFSERERSLILEQQKHDLESEAKLNQQKALLVGSILITLFSIIIIVVMYLSFRQRQKSNMLLAHKNQEIEKQATHLKESNEIKDRLFSIIAHDLRGPLSSLHAVITLIEMNVASRESLERIIPEVAEQFKYTSTLLNNLLHWSQSQMDGYRVIIEPFNVSQLICEKSTLLKSKLEEKNITFEFAENEYIVQADRNMIDLVIQNLISNAIKYSNQNGNISVRAFGKDGKACVAIADNGIGIQKDKQEELFSNRFYTTEGTNNEKGTGLGLMLCKEFVERNGGRIWVESIPDLGSTFYFTLPHP